MLIEPVEIASVGAIALRWPSRMIEPLPNCFSICPTATSSALSRSFCSSAAMIQDPFERVGEIAPDRLPILETVQAKVKRNSVHGIAFETRIYNNLQRLTTFASI